MVLHRPIETTALTVQVGNGTANVALRDATPVAGSHSILLRRPVPSLRYSYACVVMRVRGNLVAPGDSSAPSSAVRVGTLPATNGKHRKDIMEREIPGHFHKLGIVTRILH
jgi:hypothetical protein